jgi:hypothetical protein
MNAALRVLVRAIGVPGDVLGVVASPMRAATIDVGERIFFG